MLRLIQGDALPAREKDEPRLTGFRLPDLGRSWLPLALGALALGFFVVRFPIARVEIGFGLVLCAWLVLRRPESWLVIVLALLPTLDLAPWSGRYYLDEFDAFAFAAFVCGAIALWGRPAIRWPPWLAPLFGLFVVSALISTLRGLLPWPS